MWIYNVGEYVYVFVYDVIQAILLNEGDLWETGNLFVQKETFDLYDPPAYTNKIMCCRLTRNKINFIYTLVLSTDYIKFTTQPWPLW